MLGRWTGLRLKCRIRGARHIPHPATLGVAALEESQRLLRVEFGPKPLPISSSPQARFKFLSALYHDSEHSNDYRSVSVLSRRRYQEPVMSTSSPLEHLVVFAIVFAAGLLGSSGLRMPLIKLARVRRVFKHSEASAKNAIQYD
jgi:hypothetical protein